MSIEKAKGIALLDLVRAAGPLPAPVLLRVALDVFEPMASSTLLVTSSPRREGSRHVAANVVIGARGGAKLVGRGNKSGMQLLLWEILAARVAPDGDTPPLRSVTEAFSPELHRVVDAAIACEPDLADARSIAKALVIATAGVVGAHRDVAKLVARALASTGETATHEDEAVDAPPAPVEAAPPAKLPSKAPAAAAPAPRSPPPDPQPRPVPSPAAPPPSAAARASTSTPPAAADEVEVESVAPTERATSVRAAMIAMEQAPAAAAKAESAAAPPAAAVSSAPASPDALDDPMSAELDAILSEELDRIAPDGWDNWQLAADPSPKPPAVALFAAAPKRETSSPKAPSVVPRHVIEDAVTIDSDDVFEVTEARQAPVVLMGAPAAPQPAPPPPHVTTDVLVVEPDAPTAAHIAGILRRAGYGVDVTHNVEQGIARACSVQPKCIVFDDEFIDVDGSSVANRTRTASPRACMAPFIFLEPRGKGAATPSRKAGPKDVWIEKPFSTDGLLEHVAKFAGTPSLKRDSSMLPPVGEPAMDGDLSLISLRTLLSMLEFERKSGVLIVTSMDREATITFREGRATRTRVLGRSMRAADALAAMLSWNGGRFVFKPTVDIPADRWASPDLGRH